MPFKVSKYNAYRLSYRLFFPFSDTDGVPHGGLDKINEIMVGLLPCSLRTIYDVEVLSQGAVITINSINDIEVSKLVNRVKTHTAKQFFLLHPEFDDEDKSRSLWKRGYLLTTQGKLVGADEGFSMLKSKKIPLMDYAN